MSSSPQNTKQHGAIDSPRLLREARTKTGLTLRDLAAMAGTSHSTLAAYESGSKSPNVKTFDRVLAAAGFTAEVRVHRRHRGTSGLTKGDELIAVLELAAEFPTRHTKRLEAPVFGPTP